MEVQGVIHYSELLKTLKVDCYLPCKVQKLKTSASVLYRLTTMRETGGGLKKATIRLYLFQPKF